MAENVKVLILCGGAGTRLREETEYKPKPLVEIGGRPILWHIMRHYAVHGFTEFILALGYKGDRIKEYFLNYEWMGSDFTLRLGAGKDRIITHGSRPENWKITFVDTGSKTPTGGRVWRARKYLTGDYFLATYGDGLSNVHLHDLVDFHCRQKKAATLTAVHPASAFGVIEADDGVVTSFKEKPRLAGMINGGFFVFDQRIFDYLDEQAVLEEAPLRRLAAEKQLAVFTHQDFWTCMDTFKDVERLNAMWERNERPWQTWEE
ncbi:glucose-1-phosphate cytidylyltransferase [candidate division FCPU426 bacterium]|nr:glucose-1-phosphate cytidylyltransferase [candidate division FCPU426 bacterium]